MISLAYAEGGAVAAPSTMISTFIPFAIIAVLFYFILLRPEMKRKKDHALMVEEMKKGDKIVTSSGILGSVSGIKDGIVTINVGDNVKLKIKQSYISEVNGNSVTPSKQER